MELGLKGKVAIVTGGTQGIGLDSFKPSNSEESSAMPLSFVWIFSLSDPFSSLKDLIFSIRIPTFSSRTLK